jgi:hypothetical protein
VYRGLPEVRKSVGIEHSSRQVKDAQREWFWDVFGAYGPAALDLVIRGVWTANMMFTSGDGFFKEAADAADIEYFRSEVEAELRRSPEWERYESRLSEALKAESTQSSEVKEKARQPAKSLNYERAVPLQYPEVDFDGLKAESPEVETNTDPKADCTDQSMTEALAATAGIEAVNPKNELAEAPRHKTEASSQTKTPTEIPAAAPPEPGADERIAADQNDSAEGSAKQRGGRPPGKPVNGEKLLGCRQASEDADTQTPDGETSPEEFFAPNRPPKVPCEYQESSVVEAASTNDATPKPEPTRTKRTKREATADEIDDALNGKDAVNWLTVSSLLGIGRRQLDNRARAGVLDKTNDGKYTTASVRKFLGPQKDTQREDRVVAVSVRRH